MKTMKALMLAGIAVVMAACATAPSQPKGPDLSGDWIVTTESPMGSQDTELTMTQTGDQLTGKMASQMGTVDIKGTVTGGKDVAFGFSFDAQGMSMNIDYKGVVEGDTMKGTAKFGDFGEGNFTAKRKQG